MTGTDGAGVCQVAGSWPSASPRTPGCDPFIKFQRQNEYDTARTLGSLGRCIRLRSGLRAGSHGESSLWSRDAPWWMSIPRDPCCSCSRRLCFRPRHSAGWKPRQQPIGRQTAADGYRYPNCREDSDADTSRTWSARSNALSAPDRVASAGSREASSISPTRRRAVVPPQGRFGMCGNARLPSLRGAPDKDSRPPCTRGNRQNQ